MVWKIATAETATASMARFVLNSFMMHLLTALDADLHRIPYPQRYAPGTGPGPRPIKRAEIILY